MPDFQLVSPFSPQGDQPRAIAELVEGIQSGDKHQVLLGVTGSGKTFTVAKVIETVNRPILVLSHNKTLAAQLFVRATLPSACGLMPTCSTCATRRRSRPTSPSALSRPSARRRSSRRRCSTAAFEERNRHTLEKP